ncbi:MAG: molybdopterin converting factor subunit 1 [Planctomycetota bacterium]
MRVDVLLFASMRELAGAPSLGVELASGASVGDLLDAIREQYPTLAKGLSEVRVAVEREFRDPTSPIAPGAEVALIPPVSGG